MLKQEKSKQGFTQHDSSDSNFSAPQHKREILLPRFLTPDCQHNLFRKLVGANRRCSTGFTIIEMLVVIAILSLISTSLLLYSRTGERQIILFREQSRIVGTLSRAKSLSIATLGQVGVPCSYGVHFETPKKFSIFKDLASDCNAADKVYSGIDELLESFELDQAVNFGNLTLTDIVFIPPDPRIVITPEQDEAVINIKTISGNTSSTIKVTSAGQITTQ